MDPFGLCHSELVEVLRSMSSVPEDGVGDRIVRFSGFPRSHVYLHAVYLAVCVCVCASVRCAATYRIASTTHFATRAISRAFSLATLPTVK